MDEEPAARQTDEIAHGLGLLGMVAGALVGVAVGVAVVAATAATGGAAAVIIAGAVAGGGLAGGQIIRGLTTIFKLPEPTTGLIAVGSLDVYINDLAAARASVDFAAGCTGLPLNHFPLYAPVLIAEGSRSVRTNDMPQSRLKAKMVCGAHLKTSSPDVIIGGPTERTNFVFDLESWFETGLEVLGFAALIGAGVLAAAAGVAAFASFAAITGATMLGMEALGAVGDMLGPGYRDLFQGVAGMGMVLAMPRMARSARVREGLNKVDPARAVARDRAAITRLAERGRIDEARAILRPHVERGDPRAVIDRLDVSTARDRGYLWSGDKETAASLARARGANTLETTPGGRVVDNWSELNGAFTRENGMGEQFWGGLSNKYARGLSGDVTAVQTQQRAAEGGGFIYKNYELPEVNAGLVDGRVTGLNFEVIPNPPPRP
jgi:hypothetical protein